MDGREIVLLPVAWVLVPPPTTPSFGNLGLMLMMVERNWVQQFKRLQKTPRKIVRKYVFLRLSTFFLMWIFLFFPRNFPFSLHLFLVCDYFSVWLQGN